MTGRARRRERRAARAAQRQSEFANGVQPNDSREGLCSDVLTDPKRIAGDIRLVKKSLRWGLTGKKKRRIVERLYAIANKEYTIRVDRDGETVHDAELADQNALAASALLIAIEGQQQKDDHLERRLQGPQKPQAQTTINVGVNVANNLDERRNRTRALIERAGAERGIQLTPSGGSAIIVSGNGEPRR